MYSNFLKFCKRRGNEEISLSLITKIRGINESNLLNFSKEQRNFREMFGMFWNFKQPGDGGHGPGFCLQRQTMSRFVTTLTYIRLCAGRSRFSSVKYALHFHRIVAAQRWRVACERRDGFVIGWKKKKEKKGRKKKCLSKGRGAERNVFVASSPCKSFCPDSCHRIQTTRSRTALSVQHWWNVIVRN